MQMPRPMQIPISAERPLYDSIMILPSDAVVVQMDYNIRNLLIDKEMLVASGVDKEKGWSVYSDVMIWNLAHPLFHNVTETWLMQDEMVVTGGGNDGRRSFTNLMSILKEVEDAEGIVVVQEIPKELVNGLEGTVIKYDHVFGQKISEKDLPKMVPVVQGISDNVCYRYYPQCEIVYFYDSDSGR